MRSKILYAFLLLGIFGLFKVEALFPAFDGHSVLVNSNSNTYNGNFDYVKISSINLTSFASGITFELWTFTSTSGGSGAYQPILYYGDGSANFILITPSDGTRFSPSNFRSVPRLIVVINSVMVANVTLATGNTAFIPSSWHHVALSISFSNPSANYISVRPYSSSTSSSFNVGAAIPLSTFGSAVLAIGGYDSAKTDVPVPSYVAQPLCGAVDEFRIWNVFRPESITTQYSTFSYNGNEPNLYFYGRFDEGSGSTTVDSSPFKWPVTLAGSASFISNSINPASPAPGSGNVVNIQSVLRTIKHSDILSLGMLATGLGGTTDITYTAPTPPSKGKLCAGAVSTANGCTTVSSTPISANVLFYVTYFPLRDACGTYQNYSILADSTVSSTSVTLNHFVQVLPINPTVDVSNYLVDTTGGFITITGSNFGLTGNLSSSESITLRNAITGSIPCSNPTIGSNTIQCYVPPGTGYGSIGIILCNGINVTGATFSYRAPEVSYVTSASQGNGTVSSILIVGRYFGTQNTFIKDQYNSVNISGFDCSVFFRNDTQIQCSSNAVLVTGTSYTLNLRIGGQQNIFTFTYSLCTPSCQNGGKCIAFQQCDCAGTGFQGEVCQTPLNCTPPCINGGSCFSSRTADGKSEPVCQCTDGWSGQDCSVAIASGSESNAPIIIGFSVGGGVIILVLLAAIVFLFFFRKPKRGTKNFIPLEKKDFTKIIYGDQLNAQPEKTTGNLEELEKILLESDLKAAFAVSNATQITEADKIAKALVIIFQENNKISSLLENFIDEEVKTTESAGTLFRSNSMVSKMFKFYSRLIGLPYLYITIGPEIDELITAQLGLEVDPEKMEEGTDLDEMRWMLMAQSQKILKYILNSAEDCPVQFRTLFAHIKYVVGERFPENVNTTIGGFIFLRFFCPAISSPEAYGILEEPPSPSSRRLLILITKVLQNLSNDVEFGSKEPYMAKMNDFIQSNRAKLADFYEKLIKPTNKPNTEITVPNNMKKVQLALLANHIRSCLDSIEDADLKKRLDAVV